MRKTSLLSLMAMCAVLFSGYAAASCSIALNAPVDDYYTKEDTQLFNYTVTGNQSYYDNVSLFINGLAYGNVSNLVSPNATQTGLTSNGTLPYAIDMPWYIVSYNGSLAGGNCTSETREISRGSTNTKGMDRLDKITGDFASIFSGNLITLIVAMAIISVIGLFVMVFYKYINKAAK